MQLIWFFFKHSIFLPRLSWELFLFCSNSIQTAEDSALFSPLQCIFFYIVDSSVVISHFCQSQYLNTAGFNHEGWVFFSRFVWTFDFHGFHPQFTSLSQSWSYLSGHRFKNNNSVCCCHFNKVDWAGLSRRMTKIKVKFITSLVQN